ncbi:MAG: UTP--glucose-1-phosphate uridylyltransferase, partial [Spirochaetaceae bacterium]
TQPKDRSFSLSAVETRLAEIAPEIDLSLFGTRSGDELRLTQGEMETIGILLYPYLSYGVLNGGSATSYADEKKNTKGYSDAFPILKEEFSRMAELASGRPKGLTPAFLHPDGTPGPSFLELKMRSLLLEIRRYHRVAAQYGIKPPDYLPALAPFFQMTSVFNEEEIAQTYEEYERSPYLAELIEETGVHITKAVGAAQPMIAAYTHSEEGRPKGIFDNAWGKRDSPLGLPGGHGQNFSVLKETYQELYSAGKRFVYLGNVDNLGFTVDPVSLALVALTGTQAGFDFAFRTPVDIKGGILVRDQKGRLNAADIGPAISKDEVLKAEERGSDILFNCATGLFSLDYLVPNIDNVIEELPMRFSDQDKDAGRYSQAEQVTWEIIGMLDDFLVFGISKYERFIAAKMLMETLFSSGSKAKKVWEIEPTAKRLHEGLNSLLEWRYWLTLKDGRWVPWKGDAE